MPYWKCFLGIAALTAFICGCLALWDWIEGHAPQWVQGVLVLTLMTAIMAVLPWAFTHT